MKVELTIDLTQELSNVAISALDKELLNRLQNQFYDCSLVIRRAGSVGLSIYSGVKNVMKKVKGILQHTWKSADDWFY